jgi:hypothetical protein
MRIIALLCLLGTLSGVAIAQTNEQCQPIQRAGDLLACYNRTAPPHTLAKPKTSKASTAPDKSAVSEAPIVVDKPAESKNQTDRAKYVDVLAVENSKLDAKMKTICRGC